MGLYGRAIKILEQLVNVDGQSELAGDLAKVKTYHGLMLIDLGDLHGGKREARNAMAVLSAEFNRTGRADLEEVNQLGCKALG